MALSPSAAANRRFGFQFKPEITPPPIPTNPGTAPWANWVTLHITGMGLSYILMLTAFYVDNGKNLPLWRELPKWAYWALPGAIGILIIIRALLRHPLMRRATAR
jgi:hypothetical protein